MSSTNKPLHVKPEIGATPSFLSEGEHASLGTTALFRRAIDAIKTHKAYATGAFDEYCAAFSSNLERFRLAKPEGDFDEAVVKSIEDFLPYRDEAIQLFVAIAQYAPTTELIQRLHRFLENLIPYLDHLSTASQWNEWDFDNFRFLVHELFLYALAVLIKYDKFEQASQLLLQPYFVSGGVTGRDTLVDFTAFRSYMRSFELRNRRLKLRRLSLRADLLKQRATGTGIDFRYLMQADFVAFMRADIASEDHRWWPETLVYAHRMSGAFEIFARASSKSYFDQVKALLGIQEVKDLEPILESYVESRRLPQWDFDSFNPSELLGFAQLSKRP